MVYMETRTVLEVPPPAVSEMIAVTIEWVP